MPGLCGVAARWGVQGTGAASTLLVAIPQGAGEAWFVVQAAGWWPLQMLLGYCGPLPPLWGGRKPGQKE
jgi:hypothetical protein